MVTSAIFFPAVSNNSLFSSEFQIPDKNPGSTGIIRAWSLTASASKIQADLKESELGFNRIDSESSPSGTGIVPVLPASCQLPP